MAALTWDWEHDVQALAAIYGAFDVLYELVQKETFGAGDPRIASVDRLLESFQRILGDHLPPGLDPTISAVLGESDCGPAGSGDSRLPYPWVEGPGLEDDGDYVMHGVREAAEELLVSNSSLAAALDPRIQHPAWRRRQACDRLVRVALKAGLDRAQHPFDEAVAEWPSAPRLPKRTRIGHIDAKKVRGYFYGLVDGADSRLDWYASFDGWEGELTAGFSAVFGCDIAPGTFEHDDVDETDDSTKSRLQHRSPYDVHAYQAGYWQGQEVGEEVLEIAASLYLDAGGDYDDLDSHRSVIPGRQLARRVLGRFVDLLNQSGA